MNSVGAENKRELFSTAIVERDVDVLVLVLKVLDMRVEANVHAEAIGAFVQDAQEIGTAQIDILAVQRARDARNRNGRIRLAVRVHELQLVDWIAQGTELIRQTQTFGDVPAGAEEVHHIAVRGQRGAPLDDDGILSVFLETNGECQSGNPSAGNQNSAVDCHSLASLGIGALAPRVGIYR